MSLRLVVPDELIAPYREDCGPFLHEEHTESGAHRVLEHGFPDWVPADVMQQAGQLSEEQALALLPAGLGASRSNG